MTVIYVSNPVKKITVIQGEIADEQSVEGYVIRDETVLSTNMVSDIMLTKTEGSRVGKNEVVGTYVSKTKEEMEELVNIESEVKPHETLLVIDAMMGQDAINVITGFNDKLNLTGCVLTKMDGDTKGGVALSLRHLTNIPIKLIGDSEKLDGISEFHPERIADRILGMGDILAIIEKTEAELDKDEIMSTAKKMQRGKFDLEDFLSTTKQIKKLGPLENILKLLPGASKLGLNKVEIDPKIMARTEAIVLSMTKEERRNPDIIKASRKTRIANGCGRSVHEVNKLLESFN